MLTRLAWLIVRHRRLVLVFSGVFLCAAGALGSGAFGVLEDGGFEDPDAESTRAADALEGRFDAGAPNLVLLTRSSTGSVDDPRTAADGAALTDALAERPDVSEVESYWSLGGAAALRSDDGDEALVLAYVTGDEDAVIEDVRDTLGGAQGVLDVKIGGGEAVDNEIASATESSLGRAEMIAVGAGTVGT
jgi:RND superfamily putative drug exporter